jgi:MscS family membrane protein
MSEFLDRLYFDNTMKDYLISVGVILFILLLNRIISKYFAGLIFSFVKRIWKNVDKSSFLALVVKPLGAFVVISITIIALDRLTFPGLWNIHIYRYPIEDIFHAIGTTVLILSFIWLLLRMIDFIATILERRADMTADLSDNQLILFFKDFFKVIFGIAGILLILHFAFNLHIGNLLTGLSIVGAAVALSLRESLENLIASFVIFFDKPFTTGDTVKVQGITGTVEKIGLRSTRLRTDPKTYVTVPNKQMVDSILDNLSLRTQYKGELRLSLDSATPSSQLALLLDGMKDILSRKEVETSSVLFQLIGENSFLVNGDYFTAHMTDADFSRIREQINFRVLQLLEKLGIHLAGARKEVFIATTSEKKPTE